MMWDLHNQGRFQALVFDRVDGSVEMRWTAGRLGFDEMPPDRVRLVFKNVHLLEMRGTDGSEGALFNDQTLHGASLVLPGEGDPGGRLAPADDSNLRLYFEFTSGRTIEIDAETAE